MNIKTSGGKIFVLVGIFVFVILVALGGARTYFKWATEQYFGKITEIKENGFVIKTDENFEKNILTNQDTEIRKGRKAWVGKLQTGDLVIVVGLTDRDGFIEADVVRVVELPRSAP